jgi:hypothetical protein
MQINLASNKSHENTILKKKINNFISILCSIKYYPIMTRNLLIIGKLSNYIN